MKQRLVNYSMPEVFKRLGFWFLPLVCAACLLPLVLTKSSPSSHSLAKLSPTVHPKHDPKDAVAESQWHRQLMHQSLIANTSSPDPRKSAKTSNAAKTTPELEMKIAVARKAKTLLVATSTPGRAFDNTGHTVTTLLAGEGFSAHPAGPTIQFEGISGAWQASSSIWIEASQNGYVYVNNHWYRGRVKLISQGDSLLAVNHLNLDTYLYSVVGSEMPSHWPIEALKAQAIAARSYALARYIQPASSLYHMGADEAWQVYKGLDGEASSTHQAVNQTLGQFLSYKGGVVDSLYAATDDIVIKAHGGRGMSQTGAMRLAKQGYDYLHILGAYYPGTSLAQLQVSSR